MRTDRAVTRSSSEQVAMRPIVDRQTSVKTLPSPWGSVRRQHSSKMRTARLSAIRVSIATTRCQYHGGRYPYPWIYLPLIGITNLPNIPTPYTYPPPEGTKYERYLPPNLEVVPECLPLPVNRLTDTCKNIPFPQLLSRAVIR